jgi:hypothetical protein
MKLPSSSRMLNNMGFFTGKIKQLAKACIYHFSVGSPNFTTLANYSPTLRNSYIEPLSN